MADVQTAITTLFTSIAGSLEDVVTNNLPVIGGVIAVFVVVGIGLKFGLRLFKKA